MPARSDEGGSWRLRLEVAAEAVEEVLELLAASGSAGTWCRDRSCRGTRCRAAGRSETGSVPERGPQEVDAWFASAALPVGLAEALGALGAVLISWEPAEERDWLEEYRRSARPVRIGRFELDPREPGAGMRPPGGDDVRRLLLPARNAFGTGSHETTRLMVEALQELELGGRSVLDVGSGTGVLCFVARELGAAPVIGVDLDPAAALLAVQNAKLNRLRVPFLAGGVRALSPAARFDFVLVNVLPENLGGDEPEIALRLGAAGELVLSGVLAERATEITERWRALGLGPVVVRRRGEWTLLHLVRR
ncbi:MAG TPA: 50S ribosomal protein L11 methyltransferase [Thermoanaerobaculia bacterium]|nr:50S ribosomal protein L11 methyltransferase [Thermoanaerobaculia bacterium]